MNRVLFTLSMPNRASWNGGWSGSKYNYTITKQLSNKKVEELFGDKATKGWYYSFGDGWTACINGRILQKGERVKKSDGFCGYNWMVDSIIINGEIKT